MQLWLCLLIAFLLGSIPFGLLIAKAKGINIREHGSGNIGATNVLRVVGKKYGVSCLLLDAFKGFVPVMLAVNLIQIEGKPIGFFHIDGLAHFALFLPASEQFNGQLIHVLTALAAVLGHNYSPWVGFKGGKGIATSAGALLALMPAGVALLAMVWLLVFLISRYVSLASIVAAASLPLITHYGARFHHLHNDPAQATLWQAGTWNKPLFFFSLTLAVLAIWKHRPNIQRLREGTEHRFTRKAKSADV
jgi:glycerol-3-phosphate acyltransferase PlsY